MKTLVIAEHDNSRLAGATRHAVTAATLLGGDVDILVAGDNCSAVVDEAARVAGVSRVIRVEAPFYRDLLAENLAALVLSLVQLKSYGNVLAGSSAWGRNVSPRIAALLDVAQVSDVVKISGRGRYQRPIYAGNVLVSLESDEPVQVLTVRTTAFDGAGEGGPAPVETAEAGSDLGLSRVLHREISRSERPELGAAKIVVSGGDRKSVV